MQDQLTDHLDQQLESTSLENFSDYLKNLQQLPSLQDFFSVYIAKHDLKISQIIKIGRASCRERVFRAV